LRRSPAAASVADRPTELTYPQHVAAPDLDHPPEGVVILPEPSAESGHLDSRTWVAGVRRPTPRRLRQRVADHLARARELGEV